MHLKIALVVTVVAIVLVVACWATDWYRIDFSGSGGVFGSASVSYKFYWDHYTAKVNSDSEDSKYDDFPKQTNIKTTFDSCLTFLTVGGAVLIACAVVDALRLIFNMKSALWKWLVIFGSIAAVIFLGISFFTFLNMPDAFTKDDWTTCTSQHENVCEKLLGKDDDYYSGTLQWYPGPGWWLLLGAMIFAGIGAGNTIKSGKNNI